MSAESLNHTQALQQAITTTVACRTLIKYNSNLSAEQKEEILGEIETTLAFLNKRLEINTNIESSTASLPEKLANLLISDGMEDEMPPATPLPTTQQREREISLHHLHRLYQTYFRNEPGKGIADLEMRYKTAMHALDQLQELVTAQPDSIASDLNPDGLFSRVRGFTTALYSMFREFAALLTKVIEGQSIDIDTEAMASLQEYSSKANGPLMRDITPLLSIYYKQRQLQQQRGPLYESARDATAFLIFLQECLEQTFTRRQEVVVQIKGTISLLNELIMLLMDYGLVLENLMQSPSKSP
jgi:hypothetical protein